MSLVAYESSDEGSENEDNETAETNIGKDNNYMLNASTVQTNLKLSLPAPKVVSESTNDQEEEEEKEATANFTKFLGMLPKPKDFNSETNIEEDDNILLKKEKEVEHNMMKLTKKQTVKITVPSLSEFQDIEEDEEKKEKIPKKIIQSSEKACGLFSVLVPPKEAIKNYSKILIPQAVKNAVTKTSMHQMKAPKESNTNQANNYKTEKITTSKSSNEVYSDDEEDGIDFFGLTSDKNMPDKSRTSLLDSELHLSNFSSKLNETKLTQYVEDNSTHYSSSAGSSISTNSPSTSSDKILTSNIMNLSKEEIMSKNKAVVGPKLPVPEQEYNVDAEGNVAFDEKAIEYLCGKRGTKRKDREIDEANIIEINGEDIKPDEREWLVKALTEEPVHRPISMQNYGVNYQSKKKHQITYLAHQAKAMELELKNQWSLNRMTRKQTKSKYGF